MPYRKRLKQYCHQSLLEGTADEFTQEGKLVHAHYQSDAFELVHVHIVTRHGDRTPATEKPKLGYPKVDYNCGLSTAGLSRNWALHTNLWDGLNDFRPLSHTDEVRNGNLKLHPGTGNQTCGIGDLTSQGFLQLLNLGSLMQMAYGQLFSGIDMKHELYVQATDFRRTIRSAGAFLLGFLPNIKQFREIVNIHVQHGALNQAPPVTVPLTYKPCKALMHMRDKERQRNGYYTHEKELHWMHDKVVDLLKLKVHPKTPWTEIFDPFMTRGCHSLHSSHIFPCTRDRVCVDCVLGKKLYDFADWSISEKYPPNSSAIAVQPFLKHSIHDTMEKMVSKENDVEGRYKIMLTFTHDSMLNQLMKALGLPVKEWIPFASRLSFELWKAFGGDKYFVRVLFNGKIVTHHLPYAVIETKEVVDFTKWKKSVIPVNLWTYNKLCDIHSPNDS
jgi:hypothetical protein